VTTVTLYSRPGCHLCDDAREALARVRERAAFELDEVDIETDDALHARYLERIPVVALDGEELFDYFVDEAALLRRILYREGR
jgi:glutaredoxin